MFDQPTYHSLVLHLVFLGQVLVISFYLSRKILQRAQHVIDTYPPADYPKLYGRPETAARRAIGLLRNLSWAVLLVGVGIALYGVATASHELLGSDSQSVITVYGLLQLSPWVIAALAGLPYFGRGRRPDARRVRTAELRPRRLLDFVSPALVGLAAGVYLAFVALVAYVDQFGFPWFGGWVNVAIVSGMNLVGAGVILKLLRGRPFDSYQTYDNRREHLSLIVTLIVITSIATTTFAAIHISLKALDLPLLQPLAHSLFLQILALLSLRTYRIDHIDFEVYREEQLAAAGAS